MRTFLLRILAYLDLKCCDMHGHRTATNRQRTACYDCGYIYRWED